MNRVLKTTQPSQQPNSSQAILQINQDVVYGERVQKEPENRQDHHIKHEDHSVATSDMPVVSMEEFSEQCSSSGTLSDQMVFQADSQLKTRPPLSENEETSADFVPDLPTDNKQIPFGDTTDILSESPSADKHQDSHGEDSTKDRPFPETQHQECIGPNSQEEGNENSADMKTVKLGEGHEGGGLEDQSLNSYPANGQTDTPRLKMDTQAHMIHADCSSTACVGQPDGIDSSGEQAVPHQDEPLSMKTQLGIGTTEEAPTSLPSPSGGEEKTVQHAKEVEANGEHDDADNDEEEETQKNEYDAKHKSTSRQRGKIENSKLSNRAANKQPVARERGSSKAVAKLSASSVAQKSPSTSRKGTAAIVSENEASASATTPLAPAAAPAPAAAATNNTTTNTNGAPVRLYYPCLRCKIGKQGSERCRLRLKHSEYP